MELRLTNNTERDMPPEYYQYHDEGCEFADSFRWDQISRFHDRLALVGDTNIDTVTRAEDRGEACLREAEIGSVSGVIRVPVNCGQQLYDVIDIADERIGINQDKKMVIAIALGYYPERGEYEQRLSLGTV